MTVEALSRSIANLKHRIVHSTVQAKRKALRIGKQDRILMMHKQGR
jgi:hypothetical protein